MVLTDEERKAKKREYNTRSDVRAKNKARFQTPEYKAKVKARQEIPENKANVKNAKEYTRLKVLQYYSKLLSKSDIPCCNCCKTNNHIAFLAIDHIAGKKQMDSEPELRKIGYSSKLDGMDLVKWIMDNDFPEGFQILCSNCNFAKSFPKNNNKCPMENKPH